VLGAWRLGIVLIVVVRLQTSNRCWPPCSAVATTSLASSTAPTLSTEVHGSHQSILLLACLSLTTTSARVDPAYFRPVLNFLRTNQVILDPNVNPNGVLAEAMYFGVQSMVDAIRQMQDEALGGPDRAELTRGDLVRLIASSGLHSRLRLQGVNLSGLGIHRAGCERRRWHRSLIDRSIAMGCVCVRVDLSRLDLGNVNLSMANLSYCDLSYTTLINSTLTKCNLQHARMVHCNCNQANLVGAGTVLPLPLPRGARSRALMPLDGADLRWADMTHAHFCDADLMATDLSHSNFMVANFTGATLRNSEGLTDEEKTLAQERGAQF